MLLDDNMHSKPNSASDSSRWSNLPHDFADVLRSLSNLKSTMSLNEIVAPKISQHAVAIAACLEPDSTTGRFVVLYDENKVEVWNSPLQVVVYIEADLLQDDDNGTNYVDDIFNRFDFGIQKIGGTQISGTVTTITDRYYGNNFNVNSKKKWESETQVQETSSAIEIRISWTPRLSDISADFLVFEKMMYTIAGRQYVAKPSILNI
jgi:hypothetical protein